MFCNTKGPRNLKLCHSECLQNIFLQLDFRSNNIPQRSLKTYMEIRISHATLLPRQFNKFFAQCAQFSNLDTLSYSRRRTCDRYGRRQLVVSQIFWSAHFEVQNPRIFFRETTMGPKEFRVCISKIVNKKILKPKHLICEF